MRSHEFAKISLISALFLKNKGRQSGIDKNNTKQNKQDKNQKEHCPLARRMGIQSQFY